MNFISKIKGNKTLQRCFDSIQNSYYCFLTVISAELNTKSRYKSIFGKTLNLDNPTSFNEKLLWLKLKKYNNDPLVIQCADKYRVRDYVKKCGLSDLLVELYGVYNNADEIPWESLPNRFVLKWNYGAGMNLICKDKKQIDIDKETKKLNKWKKIKYWLPYSEMQYKETKKKIICEEYLEDKADPDVIPDYKVYCFHGVPKAILVMHDRGHDIKSEFFDVNWNLLENSKKYSNPEHITPKPKCLSKMLESSKILSKAFPFVRCDFYVVNGILYFGELTFTPAGGLYTSTTLIEGKDMTEFLQVPC